MTTSITYTSTHINLVRGTYTESCRIGASCPLTWCIAILDLDTTTIDVLDDFEF